MSRRSRPQGIHAVIDRGGRLMALGAFVVAAKAWAQPVRASVAIGAAQVEVVEQPVFTSTTVSPALVLQSPWALVSLQGTLSRVGSVGWSRQGNAVASLYSAVTRDGVMFEATGSYGGSAFPGGAATAQALGGVRVHRIGTSGDAWFGGSAGAMSDGVAWRGVRQVELGGSLERRTGSLSGVVSPTVTDDTLGYTDLLGVYTTSLGGLDLTLSAGGRLGAALPIVGGDRRVWGGLGTQFWLAPRTALQLGIGTYPVDVTQGFPAGRYASIALRVGALRSLNASSRAAARDGTRVARAAGVTEFALSRARDGRVLVRVRTDAARRVELAGDITAWDAVELAANADGWWEISLPAPLTEVIEVALRVDGGVWIAPPGTEAVVDEFGGASGRVVVPAVPRGV